MKKDWTYKKLGEVLVVERGGSPRPIQAYLTTDPNGLNWIKIGDAVEGSKYITSTKEKIKPEGLHKTRFVNKGDFILSNSMSFGRPYILDIDGCIHDGWLVLRDKENVFDKSFLYYYLSSPNVYNEFKRLAVGGVVNNLNSELVRGVTLPIPPISIQESIVRELDAIHGILEKKQEQLRELDNLAQAIFYDMFGDPITNPKQWEVKKLGELFDIGSSKRVYQSEWTTSGVPFYRAREVVKLARDGYVDNELFITEELYDKYAEKYGTPKVGDILVTAVGTLGVTYIVKEKDRFYYKDGNIICLHHKGAAVESKYVDFCFKTPFVREQIDNWSGATVGTFTIVKANTTILPLPPLSLQQSFAAKVSAIEAQKQAITQSIHHTEALLAQRMDNYFGI